MDKYYTNAEDNAAFDRCINVIRRSSSGLPIRFWRASPFGELLEETAV